MFMDRSNGSAGYLHFLNLPFKPLIRLTFSPGTGYCKQRRGKERCSYFCSVRVMYIHLTRIALAWRIQSSVYLKVLRQSGKSEQSVLILQINKTLLCFLNFAKPINIA